MAEMLTNVRHIPRIRRVGSRIILLAVLSAMLPLMILTGVIAVKFRRDLLQQALVSQKSLTGAIQNGIGALLSTHQARLKILSEDADLQSMVAERLTGVIWRFLDQNPMFFSCSVYAADGTLIQETVRNSDRNIGQERNQSGAQTIEMTELATGQAFQQVIQTGQPTYRSHLITSLQQKMLLIMLPIFDFTETEQVIGVLSTSISLQDPEIQTIVYNYPLNPGDLLALLDRGGNFIAARGDAMPEGAELLDFDHARAAQEQSSPVTMTLQGRTYLGVLQPVPMLDGYLLLAQPRQDILYFLQRLLYDLSRILLIVLVAASGLGILLSRSLAVKINQLLQGIHQVSSGVISHRVKIEGNDELAEAGDAFNQMVETLEKHRLMDQIWKKEWHDSATTYDSARNDGEQRGHD